MTESVATIIALVIGLPLAGWTGWAVQARASRLDEIAYKDAAREAMTKEMLEQRREIERWRFFGHHYMTECTRLEESGRLLDWLDQDGGDLRLIDIGTWEYTSSAGDVTAGHGLRQVLQLAREGAGEIGEHDGRNARHECYGADQARHIAAYFNLPPEQRQAQLDDARARIDEQFGDPETKPKDTPT